MRDHLGRGRINAGGDRNTLFGDVELCQSLWICPSVSASLRGTARSPPVTLVSLGFFLAGLFFTVGFFVGHRDFFRVIGLLLVSALLPQPRQFPGGGSW